MQRIISMIAVAALLVVNGGCGTLMNMSDMEKLDFGGSDLPPGHVHVPKYRRPAFAFGGIANDVAWLKSGEQPIDFLLAGADVPFSLVGDVVTLPWLTYRWFYPDEQPAILPVPADNK